MKKILLLNFLMLTFFNFAHPVTPMMMDSKMISDSYFGLFFMMMSLGTFLFSPFWGNNIDRTGTKKIMIAAPLGYLVGQLIFAYSDIELLMMVGRFLAGCFASAWIVGTASYINLISKPEDKVRHFGFQLVSANLGGIVGQTLSGYVGNSFYMHSFYVQFICLMTVSFLAFLLLENLFPETKVVDKVSLSSSFKLVHKYHFTFILVAMIMLSFLSNTFMSTIAYFGADVLEFTPIEVGRLNSYISLLGLISNLFLVKLLSNRLTFLKSFILQITMAVLGGFIIIITLVDGFSLIGFIISITLIMIFSSMYRPFTQSYLINSKKFEPGLILGIVNASNAIGMIGGSLTFSIFYAANYIYPFVFIVIYGVLSMIALYIGYLRLKGVNHG